MMNRSTLLILTVLAAAPAVAQLNVNATLTPTQLVQNVLVGGGVAVSNVTYTGVPLSRGSFTATGSNLGLSAGVILSTGDVTTVGGPASSEVGTVSGGGSDPDLVALSGQTINSAAILEFDFIPDGDSLKFNFVFASEEYPVYVCSPFNDAFGFFLSGPGLSGPFLNNAVNVALVPGGNVPITINTINSGTPGDFYDGSLCAASDPNWQNNNIYFVDNGAGNTVRFNGFTTVLTALAQVQCGETYHIKLAIGNGTDGSLQSGVFLQAGSFQSNVLPVLTASTFFGDGTAAEGCLGGNFTIFRPAGADSTYSVNFFLTGTATPGVDYTALQSPAVIPAGQDSVVLPFEAVDDGIAEGVETVIMNVYLVNACGDSLINSVVLAILDYTAMQINSPSPVLLTCDQDSVPIYASVSGGFGNTTIVWGDSIHSDQLWVPGKESGTYTVSVTDECPKTISKVISVDDGCLVIIPNVITPNGDGHNDRFVVKGIEGRDNKVQIWDRWGKEVLNVNNYRNNFSATDLNDGVYFYAIRVLDKQYQGQLQVLGSK